MALKAMQFTEVVEDVQWGQLEEGQTDQQVIYNVLLCGPDSKNGRKYRPDSFGGHEKVSAMYENKPVFYDHAPSEYGKIPERKIKDIAGVVKNARWVDGKGVVGNIHVLSENEIIMQLYRLKAPGIGMSHTASGRLDEKTKLAYVDQVLSVDVVVNPATTKSFVEQEKQNMDDSLMNELSAVRGERDGLKADRDKLQTELKEAQSKLEAVAKEVTALTEQLKTATDQVTKFEEAAKHIAHKEQVAKEITEAGLDNKLNPAVVSIIESLDADKRKVMLEEQAKVIKAIGSTPGHLPRDPAPAKTDSKGWDVEKFASQFVK